MERSHVYFQHNGWTVYKENTAEPWDTYVAINSDISAGFELKVDKAMDPQRTADFVIDGLHKSMYESEMMSYSRDASKKYWDATS